MKKLSIIVPVYNVEPYLKTTLESIINQTMKEIEIIVINDGSSDNSLQICKFYEQQDSRIKLVDKTNEGVSIARNTGIDIATGEYIMFVDSDDWISNDMCETLYNKIKLFDADLCISNFVKEYKERTEYRYFYDTEKIIEKKCIYEEVILPLIEESDNNIQHKRDTFRGPCAKIYRRDIIINNDVKFDKNLTIGEDFLFNLEYLKFVEKVVLDSNYFYHYRINNYSATNKYKNNPWKEYKKILIELEKYLKNKFEKDSYLKRLDKLKMKYFFICIGNELHPLNNKTVLENKKYIKSICEDDIILPTIKNYKGGLSKKDNILLTLLKNKIYLPLCIYIKLKNVCNYYN